MPPTVRVRRRQRAAVPTTLRIEFEAKELLKEMSTTKGMGALVSGLIRGEWARRQERARLRQLLEESTDVT